MTACSRVRYRDNVDYQSQIGRVLESDFSFYVLLIDFTEDGQTVSRLYTVCAETTCMWQYYEVSGWAGMRLHGCVRPGLERPMSLLPVVVDLWREDNVVDERHSCCTLCS